MAEQQTGMIVEENVKPEVCSVTDTAIAEMAEKYLSLKIRDVDDEEGKLAVKEAKKKCVTARGQLNVWHEAEKKYWLDGGRIVDGVKNTRLAKIEPIENHLKAEEKRIADELAAIVKRKDDNRENARKILVNDAGGIPEILQKSMMPNFIRVAEEGAFLEWLESVRAMNLTIKQQSEQKAEADRLAKIESDRQKKEKEDADRKAKEDADALAADNKRIAEELAETKRKLDDQAAAQKKAQAELDAKQKAIDAAYSSPGRSVGPSHSYSQYVPPTSNYNGGTIQAEIPMSKPPQYGVIPSEECPDVSKSPSSLAGMPSEKLNLSGSYVYSKIPMSDGNMGRESYNNPDRPASLNWGEGNQPTGTPTADQLMGIPAGESTASEPAKAVSEEFKHNYFGVEKVHKDFCLQFDHPDMEDIEIFLDRADAVQLVKDLQAALTEGK